MKSFRFSLIIAILTALALLLGLTWVLLSLISFKTAEKDLFSEKSEQGRFMLAAFVHLLPAELPDIKKSPAARFADRLAEERDFSGLALFDSRGKPLYLVGDDGTPDPGIDDTLKRNRTFTAFTADGNRVVTYIPVPFGDGTAVGRLTLSLAGEHARLKRSRHLYLTYFLLDSLLIMTLGGLVLSRVVVLPVTRLLSATERIAAGDYNHPVKVPGCAEIAALAEAFNHMLGVLREKDAAVASHVRSLELANAELKNARAETLHSEKMASVGLLAAGMAHEIGTPLAAVMGYAGILRDELAHDPEKVDYLRRIEGDCSRIDRIVRDLLDYARPASPRHERIDVPEFIAAGIKLLEGQGVFKRVDVVLEMASGLPPVRADRHQLQQALINLLLNARDAMPEGGRLTVRALRESGEELMHRTWLRIEVDDTGTGIAPEDLGRVFEPFFTTKVPGKGTGLGLAIVARIIDGCGGRISVRSRQGEGTTFIVLLPAVPDQWGRT